MTAIVPGAAPSQPESPAPQRQEEPRPQLG